MLYWIFLSSAAYSPLYSGLGTRVISVSEIESYIQGPEPIGCLARSSSVWVAGVTRMMARRSLSREKLGTLVLTVTVLASLASMDSKGWKNGA